jgi:uncharacterized protein YegP (UPF0339 family)
VTPGTYEFRFFANNGYTLLASSATVTVTASTAAMAVNGTPPPTPVSVLAGSSVTVTATDDPANATDWVALFVVSAADTDSVDWRYLNNATVPPATGVSSGTLTFQTPVGAGDYEFRFFANNGYARLATSSLVSVATSATSLGRCGP